MVAEAEKYASDLRADTKLQIRKIKTDCEIDGRQKYDLTINGALDETKRLMAVAESQAKERADEIAEKSNLDCEALKARASGNLDKAIDFIVERIVRT